MAKRRRKEFEPEVVLLTLSHDELVGLERRKREADKKMHKEIWGEEKPPIRKAYLRPPGRPDLSYAQVMEIERNHRNAWSDLIRCARKPQSRIMIPRNAWAWDLRKLRSKMDEFSRGLLQSFDLYLCRHILIPSAIRNVPDTVG